MRANLRGTPNDHDEVIVSYIEEPLPDAYYVDFTELPEVSIRCNQTKIVPDTKIFRHTYRFVGFVERVGHSPVAEYRLVKEEL